MKHQHQNAGSLFQPDLSRDFLEGWSASTVAFLVAILVHVGLFVAIPAKLFDPSRPPKLNPIAVEFMIAMNQPMPERPELPPEPEPEPAMDEVVELPPEPPVEPIEHVPEEPPPPEESAPPIHKQELPDPVPESQPAELDLIEEDETVVKPAPRVSLSDILEKDDKLIEDLRNSVSPIQPLDNRFFDFPDYLANVFRQIDLQFQYASEAKDRSLGRYSGVVVIDFIIDAQGEVVRADLIYGNVSETAKFICKQVIYGQKSYGVWTPEMIETLGLEQTLRVTFEFKL